MFGQLSRIYIRKNAVHPLTDAIHFDRQERIADQLFFMFTDRVIHFDHKVHIHFIFRQRRRQDLPIIGQNVATHWRERHISPLEAIVYRHPIVLFDGHNVERFTHNDQSDNRQEYCDDRKARTEFV